MKEKTNTNINIKTLAKTLGISTGSVSKALKDSHEISEETKRKVRELAAKLNYVPNPYASSLRKQKSKTIAVVLPEVADSFFSLAINGIEAVMEQKGYHVIISLTHELFAKEEKILSDLKSGRVDGIIMSLSRETADTNHIKALQDKKIPIVFFDRVATSIDATKIITDDEQSGYKATKHLIEQGCRNIKFLSISDELAITNERYTGVRKALVSYQLNAAGTLVKCVVNTEENVQLIKAVLTSTDKPDGLIASVEMLSIEIYRACRDLGLHIPADIKVIGFSNLHSAPFLDPPLSTITQPAFEMGKAAATELCKMLEKKNVQPHTIVIPSELHVRVSSLRT